MIVLGFDTATPATAVGLMVSEGRVLEGRDDPRAGERPGHSTRLLPLAHELLDQAQLGWGDIERIAVGVGPGTFTGLRIGVATARGLAQSLAVELVGVSSLQALAHPVVDEEKALAVIDARRGEAFAAAYSAGEELVAPRVLSPERLGEVIELAEESERAVTAHDVAMQGGGERGGAVQAGAVQAGAVRGGAVRGGGGRLGGWIAVGDGAVRFADILCGLGVTVPPVDSPLHAISGRAVCELGVRARAYAQDTTRVPTTRAPARGSDVVPGVVPNYGRAPDAEVALQGTGG
jgi:tRNA threonylcarbamoyladenosine biosynthesis protein TsaB